MNNCAFKVMDFHGDFFCQCDKNARENHKKDVLVPLAVQLHLHILLVLLIVLL